MQEDKWILSLYKKSLVLKETYFLWVKWPSSYSKFRFCYLHRNELILKRSTLVSTFVIMRFTSRRRLQLQNKKMLLPHKYLDIFFRFLIGPELHIKIVATSPSTILLLEQVELNTLTIMRKMKVLSNLWIPLGKSIFLLKSVYHKKICS